MQAIWLLLMDEEFMEAYEHGMLVTCGDGVVRRLFPRLSHILPTILRNESIRLSIESDC